MELSEMPMAVIPAQSSSSPVDFDSIRASVSRAKKCKSLRLEEHLLLTTEELREHTNLNFNEYVEAALEHFNACFEKYLAQNGGSTQDAA